jgi:HNH endonuclease
MPINFTSRQIPQVMFANYGHENTRLLQDCVRLGFISAGQGKADGVKPYYFSNQIRNLIIGDILAVYRNEVGYVGIARVISKPMPITNAYLNGQRVTNEIFSAAANMFNESDGPGYEEWLVEIKWLTAVHIGNESGSGACYGQPYFAKPLVTCSLDNQQLTKSKLQEIFDIDFEMLLKNDTSQLIKEEDDEISFPEGKEKYILHKLKERSKGLIKIAKERQIQKDPKLCCQICNFSFIENYGQIGEGFIEAHHIYPISDLTAETKTKIEDLIFVCSNCHRMLHRKRPWLTDGELKNLMSE